MNTYIIKISLKSPCKDSIIFFFNFINKLFNKKKIPYNFLFLPVKKKKITLLKSPHINKKAREQVEYKAYNCLLIFNNLITFKLREFLLIILLNKPKTIKITIQYLRK
jgi:ribosomal protein S10